MGEPQLIEGVSHVGHSSGPDLAPPRCGWQFSRVPGQHVRTKPTCDPLQHSSLSILRQQTNDSFQNTGVIFERLHRVPREGQIDRVKTGREKLRARENGAREHNAREHNAREHNAREHNAREHNARRDCRMPGWVSPFIIADCGGLIRQDRMVLALLQDR